MVTILSICSYVLDNNYLATKSRAYKLEYVGMKFSLRELYLTIENIRMFEKRGACYHRTGPWM